MKEEKKEPMSGAAKEAALMARKPIEAWCAQLGTEAWLFRATKIQKAWADGAEVTEKEYTDAVNYCAHGRL